MIKCYALVFVIILSANGFLFALTDGGKENAEKVASPVSVTADYISGINLSLTNLYDSANIWWTQSYLLPDSIRAVNIPRYPDYIYGGRIADLDERTPIKLDYNEHVLKYIDAYGVRHRDKLQIIMTRSAYYFPIFEEYLDKYGLPLELKYLAAVESALDPTAVSKSGAVGLWQFMKGTSDLFNLKVTSYIDERRDVYKSTDAACRYLKYLYETFGDWQLALAAYNGGPGTVKRAIAKSGGKTNYWELRPYFTDQMQNYVPAFIAMNYLMAYHAEHNIFPVQSFIEAFKTDTVEVAGYIHLRNVADMTGADYELLRRLNPVYTYSYIPMDGSMHTLILPMDKTHLFYEKKTDIVAMRDSVADDSASIPPFMVKPVRDSIIYYDVVSGDNFFRITQKFGCTIPEIYKWNNLGENYMLKAGDKLKIMVE